MKLAAVSERLPDSIFVDVDGLEFSSETALGGGGFAFVHRAVYNGRPVAVKVLTASQYPSASVRLVCRFSLVERFLISQAETLSGGTGLAALTSSLHSSLYRSATSKVCFAQPSLHGV
jgi:hypothetical protein